MNNKGTSQHINFAQYLSGITDGRIIPIIFIILALTPAQIRAQAATQDTIAETEPTTTVLDDLIVEGRSQNVVKDGYEYIPSKNLLHNSIDAASLIQNLAIPSLRFDIASGKLTTSSQEDVVYFINYRKATQHELQAMRVENVLKVEVLNHPSDPRFLGEANVVNFVTRIVKYGGYTNFKLQGETLTDDALKGSIYSQFSYGNLSCFLWAGGEGFHSDTHSKYSRETFLEGNQEIAHGQGLSRLVTPSTKGNLIKRNKEWAGVLVSWQNKNLFVEHSLDFSRTSEPVNRSISDKQIGDKAPFLSSENQSATETSPFLHGFWYYTIDSANQADLFYDLTYSYNKHFSNTENFEDPIIYTIDNSNKEHAYSLSAALGYSHKFKSTNSLRVQLSTLEDYYKTSYGGSYVGLQHLLKAENMLFVQYYLKSIDKFTLFLQPGVSNVYSRLNGYKIMNSWNPRMWIQASLTPTPSNRFTLMGAWGNNSPWAANYSEALVQRDELIWIKGNPALKNVNLLSAYLTYGFIPSDIWNLDVSVNYDGFIGMPVLTYAPLEGASIPGSIVGQYVNDGDMHSLDTYVGATCKLLNNRLIVSAGGDMRYQRYTGTFANSLTTFTGNASVSYYQRNFSVSAYYNSPSKWLSADNLARFSRRSSYGVKATFSIKDFKAELQINNIFRKRGMTIEDYFSPCYSYRTQISNSNSLGREILLTLSYTLSYGKRLQQSVVDKSSRNVKSAILK